MLPLNDLLSAIRQRYRLELLIFMVVFLAVAVSTIFAPRVYVATASLLFDEAPIDLIETQTKGGGDLSALLSTQADVIGSDIVAAKVVDDLKLVSPEVSAQWQAETGGSGDINLWYGEKLLSALTVAPDRVSRVLQVSYRSGNGEFSASVANGFVKAYLDQKLEIQTDPAKTYSRWYSDRIREVRANLESAQDKLTSFRRKTGIVDSDSTNAEDARLAELQGAVTAAEVGTADVAARSGNTVGQSPDVQNSALVMGLRSSIAQKAAQIKLMSVELGANHPERMAAEAELSALQSRLAVSISEQSRSMKVASSAAAGKESVLKGRLSQQKSRMLTLAADRAEYDVLKRDVDSARTAYDQVTQRLEVMRLSAAAPSAGVRQLDIARPSLLPTEPRVVLRLFLGALLGALISVTTVILFEFIKPRIRSEETFADLTGVPVLTSVEFERSAALKQSTNEKAAA